MKRVVLTILLGIAAILTVAGANAAVIVNTCTSTYVAVNSTVEVLSGWDTVAISTETAPYIKVIKYAKNVRTGIESDNMVTGIAGDTIEFRITWENQGGYADTVTLTDYIPSLMTFVSGSEWDTETNCDTPGTVTYDSAEKKIQYVTHGVHGITPGPGGYGEIRFRATINP